MTANQLSCQKCDTSSGSFYTNAAGYQLRMDWGPASGVRGTCACASSTGGGTQVLSSIAANGSYFQRCVKCPVGSTIDNGVRCGWEAVSTSYTKAQVLACDV